MCSIHRCFSTNDQVQYCTMDAGQEVCKGWYRSPEEGRLWVRGPRPSRQEMCSFLTWGSLPPHLVYCSECYLHFCSLTLDQLQEHPLCNVCCSLLCTTFPLSTETVVAWAPARQKSALWLHSHHSPTSHHGLCAPRSSTDSCRSPLVALGWDPGSQL